MKNYLLILGLVLCCVGITAYAQSTNVAAGTPPVTYSAYQPGVYFLTPAQAAAIQPQILAIFGITNLPAGTSVRFITQVYSDGSVKATVLPINNMTNLPAPPAAGTTVSGVVVPAGI